MRDLFYTLRTLPRHVWTLHPNTVLNLVLTPLGAIVALLVVATMFTSDPQAWFGPMPLVGYLGIAAILSWFVRRYSPRETLEHPLAFGAYVAWSAISVLFLTPLALCTMDSADWGTRAKVQAQQEVPLGNPGA